MSKIQLTFSPNQIFYRIQKQQHIILMWLETTGPWLHRIWMALIFTTLPTDDIPGSADTLILTPRQVSTWPTITMNIARATGARTPFYQVAKLLLPTCKTVFLYSTLRG